MRLICTAVHVSHVAFGACTDSAVATCGADMATDDELSVVCALPRPADDNASAAGTRLSLLPE